MKIPCLLLAFCLVLNAQDHQIKTGVSNKGFSYVNKPMSDKIMLFKLDGTSEIFKTQGVTLVQTWGTCCGAEPEMWDPFITLYERFKPFGLKWVSVNFENGQNMKGQKERVVEFFKNHQKPELLYLDGMGYLMDLMEIPGFPTYLLIDEKGTIIFKTNGHDAEGMRILEKELAKHVEK